MVNSPLDISKNELSTTIQIHGYTIVQYNALVEVLPSDLTYQKYKTSFLS